MRISNITSVQNIKNREGIQKREIRNAQAFILSVPISNAYLGRDLVSFGNRPFHETLKDNYFQLPQGCFPDNFQIEAGKALNQGKSVLVEAPTGTGKTAIAHYAASKNLEEGKTTFYTTPLKALSNQKLNEFKEIYGEDNVGILTGDRRENENAPILIMTTEVYRNMAMANAMGEKNPLMDNLGTVIFDEFHYLGDSSRGSVWEESVMYTPKDVQTLELSATIGNSSELNNWIGSLNSDNTHLVSIPSTARHVPLKYETIKTKSYQKSEEWMQKQIAKKGHFDYDEMAGHSPLAELSDFKVALNHLEKQNQLPAIFFVFSRKFSRDLLDYFGKENKSLTTNEEKEEIKKILEKHRSEKYIGEDLNEDALLNGYAIHNAGIIPSQKELIEELFQKKLVKAVIATETLAAGINMPAKTVVISSPYKPSDDADSENNMRTLNANEFKQMAGRAGRRGIDEVGYVYTMPTDRIAEMDFLELETMDSNPIESQYNPDYAFLCGFYENNGEPRDLKNVFEKSFFAYNENESLSQRNIQTLMQDSLIRTDLLKQKGFINEDNGYNILTDKGIMASKVKGYNAILLVDLIKSGKLANIEPETLAMIAGAIANPVKKEEEEINFNTDLLSIIPPSSQNLEEVHENLIKSVNNKFKMLGKSTNSFRNYEQMLEYAQNLQKPDVDIELLNEDLKELTQKRAKMYAILEPHTQMSLEEVAEAISRKKIVPTKVLENSLEYVEDYKRRIVSRDINTYIERLEDELKQQNTDNKGKKAREKAEKRVREIKMELKHAKNMKFLEDNLYNEINSNYNFIKKNPPEQIKKEFRDKQSQYVKLTLKDSLVDEIKGLIELEYNLEHSDEAELEKDNVEQGSNCIKSYLGNSAKLSEEEIKLDLPSKQEKLGKSGALSAYKWAVMNKNNSSGITNWRELMKLMPSSIDEGSVYRGILQTADLLSQISEVATAGLQNAKTDDDFVYYKHLKSTAQQARELMIKQPVEV